VTPCPSDLELERYLLAPAQSPLAVHVDACGRCCGRLEAMRQLGDEFQRDVYPRTLDAIVERSQRAPPRRRWRLVFAPIPALAAAAALFLWVGGRREYLGAKGGGLTLTVFVQTAEGTRAAASVQPVAAGAALRFQVRAIHPCRLWVVSVDAGGQVSRLYPTAGDAGAELPSGGVLPGGAVLDGQAGPERVFAVCTGAPLHFAAVEAAARAAAGGGSGAVREAGALAGLPGDALQASVLLEKGP
jgi:hypothetical protein